MVIADTVMDIGGAKQWRLDPALSGGGSLVDIGIYALNATRYLTGEEPVEINAMMHSDPRDARFRRWKRASSFNCASRAARYTHQLQLSYGTAQVNRYRVIGTQGWYGLDPATSYTGLQLFHGQGTTVEQVHLPHIHHVAAEMDHFSQCIHNNTTPLTPGEEGLRDVQLMQKIYQAATQRETLKVG